jgi:hypothetical protein
MLRNIHPAIAGIPWIAAHLGCSDRQARRLAALRKIPGVYRTHRGARFKVHKVQFLDWLESRKVK